MSLAKGLLALALSLGVASATFANSPVNSLYGPTGLLRTPSAGVLDTDTISTSYQALSLDGKTNVYSECYSVSYGVRPDFEVGFCHLQQPANLADDSTPNPEAGKPATCVNVKYRFQEMKDGKPGVSVGIIDLTNSVNTVVYAVGSQPLSVSSTRGSSNVTLNLGIAAGGKEVSPGNPSIIPLKSFFGGITIDLGKNFSVIVEHDGKNLNGAIRVEPVQGLVGQIGYLRSPLTTVSGTKKTMGQFSYSIGYECKF